MLMCIIKIQITATLEVKIIVTVMPYIINQMQEILMKLMKTV